MIQNWCDGSRTVARRLERTKFRFEAHTNTYIAKVLHRSGAFSNILCHYFFLRHDARSLGEFNLHDVDHNYLIGCFLLKQHKKKMVLKLENYGIALDSSQIILGQTSKKRNGRAVGKFGEGLKIGANNKHWKFSLKQSKSCLHASGRQMYVSPHQKELRAPAQVVVTIRGVDTELIELQSMAAPFHQVTLCANITLRNFFALRHPEQDECVRILDEDEGLDGHVLLRGTRRLLRLRIQCQRTPTAAEPRPEVDVEGD